MKPDEGCYNVWTLVSVLLWRQSYLFSTFMCYTKWPINYFSNIKLLINQKKQCLWNCQFDFHLLCLLFYFYKNIYIHKKVANPTKASFVSCIFLFSFTILKICFWNNELSVWIESNKERHLFILLLTRSPLIIKHEWLFFSPIQKIKL